MLKGYAYLALSMIPFPWYQYMALGKRRPLFFFWIESYNDRGLEPPPFSFPISRGEHVHEVKPTLEREAQLKYGNKAQII